MSLLLGIFFKKPQSLFWSPQNTFPESAALRAKYALRRKGTRVLSPLPPLSWDCSNNLPYTCSLKTIEIHSLKNWGDPNARMGIIGFYSFGYYWALRV